MPHKSGKKPGMSKADYDRMTKMEKGMKPPTKKGGKKK